jgi:hypothetical protein
VQASIAVSGDAAGAEHFDSFTSAFHDNLAIELYFARPLYDKDFKAEVDMKRGSRELQESEVDS